MFQLDSFVVYKNDVCRVKEIKNNYFNNEDYYLLIPINDESLKIEVPVSNKYGFIKKLISKDEIEQILTQIPNIDVINVDDRMIENEYRTLLKSGNHLDLVRIIKTTYLRNKNREDNNKKLGEKDSMYFRLAEKYLYTEFSVVLNLNYEETKQYVISRVEDITNETC